MASFIHGVTKFSACPDRPTAVHEITRLRFAWIPFNALQVQAVVEQRRSVVEDELFATAEGLDTVYLKSHRL